LAVSLVPFIVVVILALLANRPTIFAVVALRPPAIEDAAIRQPIERGFLAAGAAGFIGSDVGVQPETSAGDQLSSDMHVVVFQENDVVTKFIAPRKMVDLLDQRFSWLIGRMSLACKEDLHRPFCSVQDTAQTIEIS